MLLQYSNERLIYNYKVGKLLGIGAFGEVRMCIDIHSSKSFAIKMISKRKINDIDEAERVSREFFILTSLQHKNVIELHDVLQDKQRLFLIMELANGGSLDELLKENEVSGKQMEEEKARCIFTQILSAVKYCHRKHVLHRDLKPENVLLSSTASNETIVKVADFGLSTTISYGFRPVTPACTPCYAAPELLFPQLFPGLITTLGGTLPKLQPKLSSEISTSPILANGGGKVIAPQDPGQVDVWSLGVILFRMTQGKLPFSTETLRSLRSSHLVWANALLTTKRIIKCITQSSLSTSITLPLSPLSVSTLSRQELAQSQQIQLHPVLCLLEPLCSEFSSISSTMSASLCDLLKGMLQTDPSKRFTCDQVATHEWCAGHRVTSNDHLTRIHSQAALLEKHAAYEAQTVAFAVAVDAQVVQAESISTTTRDNPFNSSAFLSDTKSETLLPILANEVLNKSSASSISASILLEPISNRRPSFGLPLLGGLSTSQYQNQTRQPSISSPNTLDKLDTSFSEKCEKRPSISLSPLSLSPQEFIQGNISSNDYDNDIVGFTSPSRQKLLIGNAERRYSLPSQNSVTRVLNRRNSISALPRVSPLPLLPN